MSFIKNGVLQCDICGKFIAKFNTHYKWSYYGGHSDSEPPDPQHAHLKCFEGQTEKQKELTRSVSWLKPVVI